MQMTAKDIELAMWRSGLLSDNARPHVVESAAKDIRKWAGKYDLARLQLCNGIERYNAKFGRVMAELTEKDSDRLYATLERAESEIISAFREVMKRGVKYDFRRDPRDAVLRFVNRENTRDGWVE